MLVWLHSNIRCRYQIGESNSDMADSQSNRYARSEELRLVYLHQPLTINLDFAHDPSLWCHVQRHVRHYPRSGGSAKEVHLGVFVRTSKTIAPVALIF